MTRLEDLLRIMPAADDQAKLRQLADESRVARGPARDAKVDEVLQQIAWGLRAVRHPLPTRDDVERMISEWRDREPEE